MQTERLKGITKEMEILKKSNELLKSKYSTLVSATAKHVKLNQLLQSQLAKSQSQGALNPNSEPFIPNKNQQSKLIPIQEASKTDIQSQSMADAPTITSLQSQINVLQSQLAQIPMFQSPNGGNINNNSNNIKNIINPTTNTNTIHPKLSLLKQPTIINSLEDSRFNGNSWKTKEYYKRCVAANQCDKFKFSGDAAKQSEAACKFYIHLMDENNKLITKNLFLEDIFVEHILSSMITGTAKEKLDAELAMGHKFETVESILL